MRLGDPPLPALSWQAPLLSSGEGRGQLPPSPLLQVPWAAAPNSLVAVLLPPWGWRPSPALARGRSGRKGAIGFSSLAPLRTENSPFFCPLIRQLLDTRRWRLSESRKRGTCLEVSALLGYSRLFPGGWSARFWCSGSLSPVVRRGAGRGSPRRSRGSLSGDWQRMPPLQSRGWPRGAERQSTVFCTLFSLCASSCLRSGTELQPRNAARRPREDLRPHSPWGLGFAHWSPPSTVV